MSLDITPRYLWNRYISLGLVTISADSALSTAPVSFLLSPDPNKKWNSLYSFVIVTGFNDILPVSGTEVTLTAGNYSGTDLAAHIATRLQAVIGGGGWACNYNVSSPFKFRITNSSAFTLNWATTAHPAQVCGYDLGFVPTSDSATNSSQASANAVYQSRHFIDFDLTYAKSLQCAVMYKHNVSSAGIVTMMADDTPNWASPSLTTTLAGTYTGDYPTLASFFNAVTKRYVRFVINDCTNGQGYAQVGIIFAGVYSQLTRGFKPGSQETSRSLSQFELSDQGGIYQNAKPGGGKQLQLNYSKIKEVDKAELDAMWLALNGMGGLCFLALDPQNNPATRTYYGCFTQEPVYTWAVADGTPALRYDVAMQFQRHIA